MCPEKALRLGRRQRCDVSSPHAAPPNCEAMGSGGSLRLSVTADNAYFIIQPSSQPITGTLSEREVLSLRNFCDVWQKKAKEAGTRSIRPILCETFSWRNVCCKGLLLDEVSDKKCSIAILLTNSVRLYQLTF